MIEKIIEIIFTFSTIFVDELTFSYYFLVDYEDPDMSEKGKIKNGFVLLF